MFPPLCRNMHLATSACARPPSTWHCLRTILCSQLVGQEEGCKESITRHGHLASSTRCLCMCPPQPHLEDDAPHRERHWHSSALDYRLSSRPASRKLADGRWRKWSHYTSHGCSGCQLRLTPIGGIGARGLRAQGQRSRQQHRSRRPLDDLADSPFLAPRTIGAGFRRTSSASWRSSQITCEAPRDFARAADREAGWAAGMPCGSTQNGRACHSGGKASALVAREHEAELRSDLVQRIFCCRQYNCHEGTALSPGGSPSPSCARKSTEKDAGESCKYCSSQQSEFRLLLRMDNTRCFLVCPGSSVGLLAR